MKTSISGMARVAFTFATSLVVSCLVQAWQPGTSDPWAVDGFVVDRTDRRDVLAFYHCVYGASEGYADHHGWAGDAATCTAGATSEVFQDDVLRRVNFYRALTGLPGDVYLTSLKSAKSQKSALMMSKAGTLSHYPGTDWPCYTADGAEAAGAGNLSFGSYGPAAVDGYIRDDGDGNQPVGHRRWILYPRAREMGTGDIPEHSTYPSANTLWVVGDFKAAPAASFTAWPNNGYLPLPLMPARWSLSYPNADFSSAAVSMTVGGVATPVTVVSRTANGRGDNTIVWEPSSLPSSLNADVACVITVSGIGGGGPTSRTYTVRLFDPSSLGESVAISGPASPPASGQTYTFNAIEQADQYELQVATLNANAWTEGAEDLPAPKIEETVSPGYSLRQSAVVRSGSKAFQLTYPSGVFADQSFEVTRDIMPTVSSRLKFHDRARFTVETTTLKAQVTTDGGDSWTTVSSRTGVGGNSGLWDDSWVARDIDLSAYAGKVIRIRFVMSRNGGSVFQGVSDAYGFFIDDITVSGAKQFANTKSTALSAGATSFSLNGTTAGAALQAGVTYAMRVRPQVGLKWFGHGPARLVTVVDSSTLPDIAVFQPAGASLSAGSSTVGFGSMMVAKETTLTFTMRNSGTAALSGLAIRKSGTHQGDFLVGAPSATSLAPGASATFKVTFRPKATGPRVADLMIDSNDPDENPFRIALSGRGLPPPDIAVVSGSGVNLTSGTSSIGFGSVVVGKSVTKKYTIRNRGKGTLSGIVISKKGTHAADFRITQPEKKSLAPGASATFQITFKPGAKDSRKALLTVASNDPDENPFKISLAGTGK